MAARDVTADRGREDSTNSVGQLARRLSTETKAFFKTSEFIAYAVVLVGILIAANSIEANGGNDYFTADKAWLYITILTIGYMLSRGIAKSGSREPYTEDRT
jgi:hypothetical protein